MRIVYSFNKKGFEAEFWAREINNASTIETRFIPFNHGSFVETKHYPRAQLLDNLYYANDDRLARLYAAVAAIVDRERANVLIVDNQQPYHPEFLRTLNVYKVLRTSDGPLAAYDRDIPYLHAFDQVLYHSPAYSRDIGMKQKLEYCGASNTDFWPLGLFEASYDHSMTESNLFDQPRDIDILFVGAMHLNKMPILAAVKKEFGHRCRLYGLTSLKRNLYFNVKFGYPGWVRPIEFKDYVPLYRRAKIGINVHNRGKFTVGGYRLFELPGNGVMQISDGGEYLESFFVPGREIVGYETADELIDLVRYYLEHDAERRQIGKAGYHRVMRDHRVAHLFAGLPAIIRRGMSRINYSPPTQ